MDHGWQISASRARPEQDGDPWACFGAHRLQCSGRRRGSSEAWKKTPFEGVSISVAMRGTQFVAVNNFSDTALPVPCALLPGMLYNKALATCCSACQEMISY